MTAETLELNRQRIAAIFAVINDPQFNADLHEVVVATGPDQLIQDRFARFRGSNDLATEVRDRAALHAQALSLLLLDKTQHALLKGYAEKLNYHL